MSRDKDDEDDDRGPSKETCRATKRLKRDDNGIEEQSAPDNNSSSRELDLNLEDLGAGYDKEDRRVVKALNLYETKLLPYLMENQSIFKSSNFLQLKGYASRLKREP